MQKVSQKLFFIFAIALTKIVRICWRHSRLFLILAVLSTIFLGTQMSKMKIIFSPEDLAGQGIAEADEIKEIKKRYNDGVTSILIVLPPPGQFSFTAEEACRIRKWYSYTQEVLRDFKSTSSSFDLIHPVSLGENRVGIANVVSLDCDKHAWRVDPHTIKQEMDRVPWAFGNDKKDQLSLAFTFTYVDAEYSRYGTYDPKAVGRLREEVNQYLAPIVPKASISWVGPADYQWYILEGFAFSKWVNLGMLILLILSLRILFGTWKTGFIYSFSLIICAIWVFGAKGLVGSSYDVLSTGLFLILGISSLEDFVFVSGEQMRGRSWRSAVRTMIVPSFFTSLTTMIGFLSLYVSDIEVVRRLGVWAAFGTLMEWAIVIILIPCILKEFRHLQKWVEPAKSFGFFRLEQIATRVPSKSLTILSLFVYPAVFWSVGRLDFNEAPQKLFPPQQEYSKALEKLQEGKEWIGTVSLIYDNETTPQQAETMVEKLKTTKEGALLIKAHQSPQSLLTWLMEGNYFTEGDIMAMLKYNTVYEQMVDEDGRVRVLLFVKDIAVDAINGLKAKVDELCKNSGCHLGGELVAYAQFAGFVPKTLFESLATSLVLVAIIIGFLCFAFNKQSLLPSLLVSSFWGPIVMVVLLGITQSTLDFWRSLFASILVGLAGDNGIQFLFASRKKDLSEGISERGGASVVTSGTMALTSLVYLGSYFNPPKAFGVILCLGMFACLVGDLWLLRGYLELGLKFPRFPFRPFHYLAERFQKKPLISFTKE